MNLPFSLSPEKMLGGAVHDLGDALLPEGAWYVAEAEEDGLLYRFPQGALAGAPYLVADLLLDGKNLVAFVLALQEGEEGPIFGMSFGLLAQCQARMRVPLQAVNQNRWLYRREGAWLKPRAQDERVDLRRVDRLILRVNRKSEEPARWCMTEIVATADEPPVLTDPILPQGPLLDELGQSTLHEWPGKSHSPAEVTARLQEQLDGAPAQRWPAHFARWGGWHDERVEATGFFRTHHDGRRWWLVDPDGHLFWSTGPDCVRVDTEAFYQYLETALSWLPDPEGEYGPIYRARISDRGQTINYLAANLIHAFGPERWYEDWGTVALAELRRLGFNTVANWSDWQLASRAGFPYVRPLDGRQMERTRRIYRDFPDVFHTDFEADAVEFAEQLRESADDPALIGYFLMNEPTWGFANESPAAGMLFNTAECASRTALADFLQKKYGQDHVLAAAWDLEIGFDAVAAGPWETPVTATATADLDEFSAVLVERFFGRLSSACRQIDPNHLNLGVRYHRLPPAWALAGMRDFDVFSMNSYREQVPLDYLEEIYAALEKPILVGEWHFGALDVGLPGGGIMHVRDQTDRGRAYRFYLEQAAAHPVCIGAHWFTLYDQSALGRFDGENYNIGFLDICHRRYVEIGEAAQESHDRLYAVAAGRKAPYADAPEYLPRHFL